MDVATIHQQFNGLSFFPGNGFSVFMHWLRIAIIGQPLHPPEFLSVTQNDEAASPCAINASKVNNGIAALIFIFSKVAKVQGKRLAFLYAAVSLHILNNIWKRTV